MKKIAWLALFFASSLYAENTSLSHIRHIIINNLNKNIDYELITPLEPYVGLLRPKEAVIFNIENNATGTYVVRYTKCSLRCTSHNKSFLVTKNGEIIWRITKNGIVVSESE